MDLVPIVAPLMNPASIFHFNNSTNKFKLPILCESLPITLFCHAGTLLQSNFKLLNSTFMIHFMMDPNFSEARLMRAIQRLHKLDSPRSQEFKSRMIKVHQAQRNLLNSFYLYTLPSR